MADPAAMTAATADDEFKRVTAAATLPLTTEPSTSEAISAEALKLVDSPNMPAAGPPLEEPAQAVAATAPALPTSAAAATTTTGSEHERTKKQADEMGKAEAPSEGNWTNTLCPAGDGHEWDVLQEGTTAALSATGAGAGLAALICLPLMLCLPAVFYGTKSLVIDSTGVAKEPPEIVPTTNPSTGQPNESYGYVAGGVLPKTPPEKVPKAQSKDIFLKGTEEMKSDFKEMGKTLTATKEKLTSSSSVPGGGAATTAGTTAGK